MILERSALSLIFPMLLGGGISLVILTGMIPKSEVNYDELALGENNAVVYAQVDGVGIHCQNFIDAAICFDGYRASSKEDVVLLLGNSQIHAINQKKHDEKTVVPILHRKFKENSKHFLAFSQPNASLQEHYLFFEYLITQLPVSDLVLPVVFDDMRETGVRPELSDAFNNVLVSENLKKTSVGRILLANHNSNDSAGSEMSALKGTTQEGAEEVLNTGLESIWHIWERRAELRSTLYVAMYRFRNWIFGVNPSSVRKLIPAYYAVNQQSLEAILASAKNNNISVLLYVVPIRNDVKIPYDLKEYENFKQDIEKTALKYGVQFENFENIVPPEYWGEKNSTGLSKGQELDFMHFQAAGHGILANKIYRAFFNKENNRLR